MLVDRVVEIGGRHTRSVPLQARGAVPVPGWLQRSSDDTANEYAYGRKSASIYCTA
jgi:hypothetical protein